MIGRRPDCCERDGEPSRRHDRRSKHESRLRSGNRAPKLEGPFPAGAPRDDNFRSLPDTGHDPPNRSDRSPVRDRAARAPARHRRPAEAFRLANYHRSSGPAPPLPPAVRRTNDPGIDLRRPCPRRSRAPAHRAEPADLGGAGRPADHAPQRDDSGDRRHHRVAATAAGGAPASIPHTAWSRSAPAPCSAPGQGSSPIGAAPPTTSSWRCCGRPPRQLG